MEPRLYYGSSVIMDELLNLSSENWQEVLLSQRDRATLCVSWSLGNCCTTVRKKSHWKMALFDRPHITSY